MRGAYILIIRFDGNSVLRIGKLGALYFKDGIYVYVGSGMNNLEKRVERHLKLCRTKEGALRWHIDYLLVSPHSKIICAVLLNTDERIECEVSQLLEGRAIKTVLGFGSSDCRGGCKGHLHYFRDVESVLNLVKILESRVKNVSLIKTKLPD